MEKLSFTNYQEEISLNCFVPTNHLKEYDTEIFNDPFEVLTIREKMLLVVLDRDGYFYSDIKPSPMFLKTLKDEKIYVQAFCAFTQFKRSYGCFLKSFFKNNPEFKPLNYI